VKKFFECLVPGTTCNLKCNYCYVVQENRKKSEKANFLYNPEHIGKALSVERLDGISLISMTAAGETLLPKEMPLITHEILKQGHFVNITTNGTFSKRFNEILDFDKELLPHLNFSFSFHYLELIRTNKLGCFFENINKVKLAGCSFVLQINLCDEYIPHWDDIKQISINETGALPQVALTRDESIGTYKILTNQSVEEYMKTGKEMNSPLFDFTCKNFMVKRKEFCYAGEWSAKLNLGTGEMTGCYGLGIRQNIFKDITKPIRFKAIGNNCNFKYCFNSSHFMSLGVIPEILTPSYGDLRNRKEANWYSSKMEHFLSERLYDDNKQYTNWEKFKVNFEIRCRRLIVYPMRIARMVKHKLFK
jgi:organic radical activating enzyme